MAHGGSKLTILFMSAVISAFGKAASHIPKHPGAEYYLIPHVRTGETLSDVTYRVIALHGPGFEDSVVQLPATGTYTFTESKSPEIVPWRVSVRMDGKASIRNVEGDYRDHGTTMCFAGKCNVMRTRAPRFTTRHSGELPKVN